MNYYAIIDTNVIVSSLIKKQSFPGKIVEYALYGDMIPLLNNQILDEYEEVLKRKEFGFNDKEINEFMAMIKHNGIVLERENCLDNFSDGDDKVFYEIMLSARNNVDAYLITGNIKHFPNSKFVITPKQMIEKISQYE